MSLEVSVARYNNDTQEHSYQYDSGVVVTPRAQRTAGHRRIRLHGGVGMRVVKWQASRQGKPPIVPTPRNTANDTILSHTVVAPLPTPQPQSGTYVFTMFGEYVYVQNEPRILGTNALPTGAHPYPIEPNDTIARDKIQAALNQAGPITDLASFDAAMDAIEAAVIPTTSQDYVWPITVFPTVFVGSTIAG